MHAPEQQNDVANELDESDGRDHVSATSLRERPMATWTTLKGRNEEKVKFSAEHFKKEIESKVQSPKSKVSQPEKTSDVGLWALDLMISGPAPAPLLRAETFYRYQIMLRTSRMSALSRELAKIIESLALPEDVTLAVDIDPVDLS